MDRRKNRPNRPLIRKVCALPSKNQPLSKPQCFFVVETRRVAPASRSAFSPMGGPASGPFSNSAGGARSPAPVPAPPTPTCITADLFADCFTTGNVGWTEETPPGTVVFADQKVYLGSGPLFSGLPQGEIRKPILIPAGAWTLRYQFTEVNFTPTFNKLYLIGIFNGIGTATAVIQFTGDGTGFAGDLVNFYSFVWTPVQGATHSVILKSDGLGNLTLTLDGVNIPLTLVGPEPATGTPSVIDIIITDNDEADGKGSFDSIFFSNGNIPDEAEFCCP